MFFGESLCFLVFQLVYRFTKRRENETVAVAGQFNANALVSSYIYSVQGHHERLQFESTLVRWLFSQVDRSKKINSARHNLTSSFHRILIYSPILLVRFLTSARRDALI